MSKFSNDSIGTALAVLLAGLVAIVALFLFQAWVIMILAGALHGSVSASVPAIGFGGAVIVSLGLSVLGSFFKSYNTK